MPVSSGDESENELERLLAECDRVLDDDDEGSQVSSSSTEEDADNDAARPAAVCLPAADDAHSGEAKDRPTE